MLGDQLKQARLSKGLSLRQLAEISGVGYTHIQRIEHGHDASLRTINKLLSALGKELTIK